MVSNNIDGSIVKGPYQDIKKDKSSTTTSIQRPQQQQPRSQEKDDKNGAWGSVYKNKQNFIDMHLC